MGEVWQRLFVLLAFVFVTASPGDQDLPAALLANLDAMVV
jgi:hypothetical protein